MTVALFIAIFFSLVVAILFSIIGAFDFSGKQRIEARERRMAEHRMNARLLRFNI